MNPDLNGRTAALATGKPWVVLAVDRLKCGQPVLAVTEDLRHKSAETPGRPFARFRYRVDAEAWLREHQGRLDPAAYRYLVDTI